MGPRRHEGDSFVIDLRAVLARPRVKRGRPPPNQERPGAPGRLPAKRSAPKPSARKRLAHWRSALSLSVLWDLAWWFLGGLLIAEVRIRRLGIGEARIKRLTIDELTIGCIRLPPASPEP